MKKIRQIGCAVLAGIFLCGVLAIAAPQVGKETQLVTVSIAARENLEYTMSPGDCIQLEAVGSADNEPDTYGSKDNRNGSGSGSSSEVSDKARWTLEIEDIVEEDGKEIGDVLTVSTQTGLIEATNTGEATVYGIDDRIIHIKVIRLTPEKSSMKVGETQTIELIPAELAEDITWESSDPDVIAVDNAIVSADGKGIITAIGKGQATIYAKALNGDEALGIASCSINVSGYILNSISIEPSSISMNIGDSKAVSIQTDPANAEPGEIKWKSSDTSIAYYKDGKIYASAPGTATITATTEDGKTASCTVKVIGSLSINPETMTLKAGATGKIKATVTPNGTAVTWSSSNAAVAKVDKNGTVTAVKKGTAVITAKAGGLNAVCKVTVQASATPSGGKNPTTPTRPSKTPANNAITSKPYYNFTTANGTGGFLYIPGSVVPVKTLYTMPQNIPSAAYLTIDSDLGTDTETIADTLSGSGISATFFVPIDDLYAADDALRHIAGSGNSIGFLLTADQANAGNTVDLLNYANEQLSVITGTPTHLVRIAGGSSGNITSEKATILANAGYRLWDWNSAARETVLTADSAYNAVCNAMNTTNSVTIRFGSSAKTTAVLQQLLPYMKYCGIPAKAISAGDIPVCNTAIG